MRARTLHEHDGQRTIAIVFDKGDDPRPALDDYAATASITAASFTAIGAFSAATLGYFDRELGDYRHIEVTEQVEVLSCLGDIAVADGAPSTHAHVVLGRRDGSTVGGHLLHAAVWPTLEVMLHELPAHLQKRYDSETGLALIAPLDPNERHEGMACSWFG